MNIIDQLIADICEYSAPFEPNTVFSIVKIGTTVEVEFAVDYGEGGGGHFVSGDTIEQTVRRLHEMLMLDGRRQFLYSQIVFNRTTSELQQRAADSYNDAIFYRLNIDTAETQTYNGKYAAQFAAATSAEARARMGVTDDDQIY